MKKQKQSMTSVWIVSGVLAVMVMGGGLLVLKMLISDDGHKRQRQIQMVTLAPPPPPPKIKEKPPEPKIKKEEIMEEPKPDEAPPDMPDQVDDMPAGDQLGLDADGTAGSDGFGLKANKGGRSLLESLSSRALIRKHRWYIQIIQDEIKQKVRDHLDQNGGLPDEKLETVIELVLDSQSSIMSHRIVGSSGDQAMDKAVVAALETIARFSEPLPGNLQKASLEIRVSSSG